MVNTLKTRLAVIAVSAFALLFVGVQSASAITASQLMAAGFTEAQASIVLALMGGSSTSTTGTSSCSYTHTVTLKQGSKGTQVAAMQGVIGAITDGNFGSMTKSKVETFQSNNGLTVDGVVGAMTGAKMAASCQGSDNNDNNNDNGSDELDGSFGTISDVTTLSQFSNEEVGEGDSEVKVLGFEVEAANDGDIMITSLKLNFDPAGNGSGDSDNLDDYIDGVTVWMGDEEVASADVSDFTENSNDTFTKTISLDNAIVRAEETEKFYVSVDASGNLDSGDIDSDSWSLDVDNIRYEDGSGVVTTDVDSGDINNMNVAMSFVDFGTAADTELKISTDSDSPEAQVVIIDDQDTTDNVTLLIGKIELEGTSDAVIDQFPVTLTTSGATDLDEITGSLTLIIDGEEYTESVSTSALTTTTVTFDNMDFDLTAGDTIEFTIKAEVNDIETGLFEEGDMLKVDVQSGDRVAMDVENEEGDALSESERTGTATGEYQEFRTEGIMVELVDTNAISSGQDDTIGTFEIEFKVTAIGDAAYLGTTVSQGLTYTVDASGTTTTAGVSAVLVNNTDTDVTSQGNYLIEEGESETLTLTVSRSNDAAGLFRANLTGVKWDSDDANTTMANTYTSNMDDFHTSYITLQ